MRRGIVLIILMIPLLTVYSQYKLENAYPHLNFLQPLDFQIPPDETNRAIVVTQEGIIYVFTNDSSAIEKKVFLNIKRKVISGGELGLLGLVFHPDFKKNKYFYINYTTPSPLRTVIARFTIDKNDPNMADTTSEVEILTYEQPYVNHKAGELAFGPDGYLYIGTGDGGSGGDPQNNGQNKSSILGKMLRIDVDHTQGNKMYSIPGDNPFAHNTEGFIKEIYAWGFRNPWRYSFDRVSKLLWVGDVGEDKWEEIDIVEKGKDYGWSIMEGLHCFKPGENCEKKGLTMPIFEYGHNENTGYCIIGGYIYRGNEHTELYGKYIYADFVVGRVWALTYDTNASTRNELLINSGKNISSLGIDRNNEIYICSYDGRIYKLAKSVSILVQADRPKSYDLFFNYTDPLNYKTTIFADIISPGDISIEIFNIKGEKITDIYKGSVQPGRYKYSWDGSSFPEGIYIFKLTAGDLSIAKKLVLIK